MSVIEEVHRRLLPLGGGFGDHHARPLLDRHRVGSGKIGQGAHAPDDGVGAAVVLGDLRGCLLYTSKRHRISFALAAAAILLLLSTVILIFYDFAARLRYHYHEAAAALLLRAVLLCLLLTALLVLVGFILFLLQKEKTRRLVTERGQFYLLSHFAHTCLFELSYETGGLRLSDNLPPGLDLPPEARSLTGAALFRSLLHGEDRPRVCLLYTSRCV